MPALDLQDYDYTERFRRALQASTIANSQHLLVIEVFREVLDRVPDVEPEEYDRI